MNSVRRLAITSRMFYPATISPSFGSRFLGCTFLVEPRVATRRFFESALQFLNTAVTDPVIKSDIYDHLQSQLKSQKKTFAQGLSSRST